MLPVVVIVLMVLEASQVVAQDVAVARGQSVIIGRLPNRVDDVVQNAVVPTALIEVRLKFSQLFFRFVEACAFFVARVYRAPDVVQICPNFRKDLRSPTLTTIAFVAFVIPVLGGCSEHERRGNGQSRQGSPQGLNRHTVTDAFAVPICTKFVVEENKFARLT